MDEGWCEPTAVVFRWDPETPTISLGALDNADLIDHDRIDDRGLSSFRRHAQPGGAGVHVPETPLVQLWYRKDSTPEAEINRVGEAFNGVLQEIRLATEYRPIDGVEINVGGDRFKIGATGAGTSYFDDYVTATAGPIWGATEDFGLLDDVLTPPPEKFEDEDTDELAIRMRPLETLLAEIDVDVTRDEVIDGMVREFATDVVGDETIDSDRGTEERDFLDRATGVFTTDSWTFRESASRTATQSPDGYDVGSAAHKSRKTLQATTIVGSEGQIDDIELSGDLYIRPQPTIGEIGAIEEMERALVELDPSDRTALEDASRETMAEHDIEAPASNPNTSPNPCAEPPRI